jgi:hypothetical protein
MFFLTYREKKDTCVYKTHNEQGAPESTPYVSTLFLYGVEKVHIKNA